MRCHCKHFHLLNSVVKCGLAFQMQIYICKSIVYKMCFPMQSLLCSLKVLAVHVIQITKTCRFAARRARPAYIILVLSCVVLSVLMVLLPTTPLLYINNLLYLTIIILSLFSLLFSSVASRRVCPMLSNFCLINKLYCL